MTTKDKVCITWQQMEANTISAHLQLQCFVLTALFSFYGQTRLVVKFVMEFMFHPPLKTIYLTFKAVIMLFEIN